MDSRKGLKRSLDRLFVVWAVPKVYRHVIGELWRSGAGYSFGYRLESLEKAISSGFQLLVEFPERRGVDHPYTASYLFRTFQQRIPSPSRADYQATLESWGIVHGDDPFEILAKSGGVQLTDRLEVSEYRALDDDLSRPLAFRLAGESHFTGVVAELQTGTPLALEHRPGTPTDPFATVVLIADGRQVGWVPREYSQLVASHLDRGSKFQAHVERLLILPEERGRYVVRLSKRTP